MLFFMKSPVILGDALQGGAANSTGRLEALIEQGVPIERWHFSKAHRKIPNSTGP